MDEQRQSTNIHRHRLYFSTLITTNWYTYIFICTSSYTMHKPYRAGDFHDFEALLCEGENTERRNDTQRAETTIKIVENHCAERADPMHSGASM